MSKDNVAKSEPLTALSARRFSLNYILNLVMSNINSQKYLDSILQTLRQILITYSGTSYEYIVCCHCVVIISGKVNRLPEALITLPTNLTLMQVEPEGNYYHLVVNMCTYRLAAQLLQYN